MRSGKILDVLNRYKNYTVSNYVRKGYQEIMDKVRVGIKTNKTYTAVLNELRGEDNER